jgi:uncharacterized damage-inducible protein DinB
MNETFEQYVARILSYAGPDARGHRRILERTPATLLRRAGRATRRRLTKRPRPGKWSVRDILAHLSEVELLWGCRMRLVLGENGVPLVGMDQAVWAKRYGRVDPRRALATFMALRRANLDLLAGLRPAEFRRWGKHSQFGRLTVARMVALLAGHDINHSRQIETILNGKPKKGRSRRAR